MQKIQSHNDKGYYPSQKHKSQMSPHKIKLQQLYRPPKFQKTINGMYNEQQNYQTWFNNQIKKPRKLTTPLNSTKMALPKQDKVLHNLICDKMKKHCTRTTENSKIQAEPILQDKKTKPKTIKAFKSGITDHDYTQFSLKITEDIIKNHLYSNEELQRVFRSHTEANRGRLNMEKMQKQIVELCKEMRVPRYIANGRVPKKQTPTQSPIKSANTISKGCTCTISQNVDNSKYINKNKVTQERRMCGDNKSITNDIKTIYCVSIKDSKHKTSSSTVTDAPEVDPLGENYVNDSKCALNNISDNKLHSSASKIKAANNIKYKIVSRSAPMLYRPPNNSIQYFNPIIPVQTSSLEFLEVLENTDIKIRGTDTNEINCVLPPGPIYLPKLTVQKHTSNKHSLGDPVFVVIHQQPASFSYHNFDSFCKLKDLQRKTGDVHIVLKPEVLCETNKSLCNLKNSILSLGNFDCTNNETKILQYNNIQTNLGCGYLSQLNKKCNIRPTNAPCNARNMYFNGRSRFYTSSATQTQTDQAVATRRETQETTNLQKVPSQKSEPSTKSPSEKLSVLNTDIYKNESSLELLDKQQSQHGSLGSVTSKSCLKKESRCSILIGTENLSQKLSPSLTQHSEKPSVNSNESFDIEFEEKPSYDQQFLESIPETLIKREMIEMIAEQKKTEISILQFETKSQESSATGSFATESSLSFESLERIKPLQKIPKTESGPTIIINTENIKKEATKPISAGSLVMLQTLDKVPEIANSQSIITNIENVKKELEQIRRKEIPVAEYIRLKYNFSLNEVKPTDQTMFITADSDSDDSTDVDQEPLIKLEDSTASVKQSVDSQDVEYTCCGLMRLKKKKRRDDIIIEMDNQNASTNYNISLISRQQLEKEKSKLHDEFENNQKLRRKSGGSMTSSVSDLTQMNVTPSASYESFVKRQTRFN